MSTSLIVFFVIALCLVLPITIGLIIHNRRSKKEEAFRQAEKLPYRTPAINRPRPHVPGTAIVGKPVAGRFTSRRNNNITSSTTPEPALDLISSLTDLATDYKGGGGDDNSGSGSGNHCSSHSSCSSSSSCGSSSCGGSSGCGGGGSD